MFAELCLAEVPFSAPRLTDLFKEIESEALLLAVSPLLVSFLIARPFSNFPEAFRSPLAGLLCSEETRGFDALDVAFDVDFRNEGPIWTVPMALWHTSYHYHSVASTVQFQVPPGAQCH